MLILMLMLILMTFQSTIAVSCEHKNHQNEARYSGRSGIVWNDFKQICKGVPLRFDTLTLLHVIKFIFV